eukprot:TRINITY_DN7184_c0_g1_i14.p1 TRINITY_DN7184_c0_g1~~TRINITY_DN7184_c0_g1_i14.p1  ORF type:complete len:331 (+),score=71.35 TRINITY_DN7184_c0_g1_i14:330-1322(+)
MTTMDGAIRQWFLSEAGQIDTVREHTWRAQILREGERVESVQASEDELYLLTDHGRVLLVEREARVQSSCMEEGREGGGMVWRVSAVEVTPEEVCMAGHRVGQLAVSPFVSHGCVTVLESSAVLPLGQSEVERAPLKAASVHVTNTQVVTLSRKGRVYCTNLTDEPPAIPAVLKMGGVRVAQVACGENNITMLGTGGEVYSYGEARYSGLGMRAHVQLHKPSLVQDPQLWGQKVRWISCGAAHTVALTAMHQLFTWGSAQGPTGLDQLTPKMVGLQKAKVLHAVCGPHCTVALTPHPSLLGAPSVHGEAAPAPAEPVSYTHLTLPTKRIV